MFPRAPQNKHTFFFYPRLRRKYPQRPAPLLITFRGDNFSWSSSINSIFLFIALWSLYLFFWWSHSYFEKSPIDRFPNLISFLKTKMLLDYAYFWLCFERKIKICDWVWQKHKWILFVLIFKAWIKKKMHTYLLV